MKKLFALMIATVFLISACSNKDRNNLENSVWKRCGEGTGHFPDILDFRKDYLFFYVKNDSIYLKKSDSVIGAIDTIEYYYGERRLFIKDFEGKIERYCEK